MAMSSSAPNMMFGAPERNQKRPALLPRMLRKALGRSSVRGSSRGNKAEKGNIGDSPHLRLGALIEERDWDSVRSVLSCDCALLQPSITPCAVLDSGVADNTPTSGYIDSLEDFTGQNSLHHLCRLCPPPDIVSLFAARWPEVVLAFDCLERTPLHIAAGWGVHSGAVSSLLDTAARQLANMSGRGAVRLSASDSLDFSEGDSDFRQCLQRVAGKQDAHGKTPLHFAAMFLFAEVSRRCHKQQQKAATSNNAGRSQNDEVGVVKSYDSDIDPVLQNALGVIKILSHTCPRAAQTKDVNGMIPADYIIGHVGGPDRGRAQEVALNCLRTDVVTETNKGRRQPLRCGQEKDSGSNHGRSNVGMTALAQEQGERAEAQAPRSETPSHSGSTHPAEILLQESPSQEEGKRRERGIPRSRRIEIKEGAKNMELPYKEGVTPTKHIRDKKTFSSKRKDSNSNEKIRQKLQQYVAVDNLPPVLEIDISSGITDDQDDDGISVLTTQWQLLLGRHAQPNPDEIY